MKYKTKAEIEAWLDQMDIKNYTIHPDFVVDVPEDVAIWWYDGPKLTEIPIQFGTVNGYFDCSNNNLTSLKGCPYKVNGYFSCTDNLLTSLQYCPKEVKDFFHCEGNKLQNLLHLPKLNGNLIVDDYLKSLPEYQTAILNYKLSNL